MYYRMFYVLKFAAMFYYMFTAMPVIQLVIKLWLSSVYVFSFSCKHNVSKVNVGITDDTCDIFEKHWSFNIYNVHKKYDSE